MTVCVALEGADWPRSCRLEYAYEKRESFVKHVLENVDNSSRETAPSEQDPFAVLGLSRGASSQQVRANKGTPRGAAGRGRDSKASADHRSPRS